MTVSLYAGVAGRPAGVPLVLLHAFPVTSLMWPAQARSLADVAYVITPDQRGFGRSPMYGAGEDRAAPPSLTQVADDLAALLDRLSLESVVLGGVSMGGYVVMEMLRRHPERIRAIALIDTKMEADSGEARAGRLAMAETVLRQDSSWEVVEKVVPNLLGPTTLRERANVPYRVGFMAGSAAPESVAWAQRAMAARPDSTETLRGADVPALVVVGDEDAISPPPMAEAMAQTLPQADLVVVRGAGHLSPIEAPEAVSGALRAFLARLPG